MVRTRALAPRHGFTLVEVMVSLVLLAVALLGLAAVAAVAATSLHTSLAQERAARHAGAILDSLAFDDGAGDGNAVIEGITYTWSAPPGPGAQLRVSATLPGPHGVVLEFTGSRIAVPSAGAP